jgi:hypothetical protein
VLDTRDGVISGDHAYNSARNFNIRIVRREMRSQEPRSRRHHVVIVAAREYLVLRIRSIAEELIHRDRSVCDRANRIAEKRVERTRMKFHTEDSILATHRSDETPQLYAVDARTPSRKNEMDARMRQHLPDLLYTVAEVPALDPEVLHPVLEIRWRRISGMPVGAWGRGMPQHATTLSEIGASDELADHSRSEGNVGFFQSFWDALLRNTERRVMDN